MKNQSRQSRPAPREGPSHSPKKALVSDLSWWVIIPAPPPAFLGRRLSHEGLGRLQNRGTTPLQHILRSPGTARCAMVEITAAAPTPLGPWCFSIKHSSFRGLDVVNAGGTRSSEDWGLRVRYKYDLHIWIELYICETIASLLETTKIS